jgi:hypothetical protein
MLSSPILTSPDGDRWRVRRRWMNRSLPKLWRRWRRDRDDVVRDSLRFLDFADGLAGVVASLAIGLVFAALLIVLLPLIGLALELGILLALLSSGLIGRVLLGRPWIIEAVNVERSERSAAFAAKGWQHSRRVIEELTTTIPALGLPTHVAEATPLLQKQPVSAG